MIRLRVPSARGVLWQKERLLNIGVERAPAHCRKMVWADLDIDFLNEAWVRELSVALDAHDVVQPFAWAYRMLQHEVEEQAEQEEAEEREERAEGVPTPAAAAAAVAGAASPRLSEAVVLAEVPTGNADGQMLHSAGFGLAVLRSMNRTGDGIDARLRGHSGYACAARRDFLERIGGLYDRMVRAEPERPAEPARPPTHPPTRPRDHCFPVPVPVLRARPDVRPLSALNGWPGREKERDR